MDKKITPQLTPITGTLEEFYENVVTPGPENTERCPMCCGSGRGEEPYFPCLNCDGCGYIWIENQGLLGLYGKVL
jgi:hypothetical protein